MRLLHRGSISETEEVMEMPCKGKGKDMPKMPKGKK